MKCSAPERFQKSFADHRDQRQHAERAAEPREAAKHHAQRADDLDHDRQRRHNAAGCRPKCACSATASPKCIALLTPPMRNAETSARRASGRTRLRQQRARSMPGCHGQCAPSCQTAQHEQPNAPRSPSRPRSATRGSTRWHAHGVQAARSRNRTSPRPPRHRAPLRRRPSPSRYSRTGDQSGIAGGIGASCDAAPHDPAAHHRQQRRRIDDIVLRAREEIAIRDHQVGELPDRDASLLPSSFENHVTYSVHMRSAVSRSSRLRCGYIRIPPTVLPVTSHASDTHGCTTPPASRRCRPTP